MISALEFYNDNLINEDVYDEISDFRIFRIRDFKCEPVPVIGSEEFFNSTEYFPKKYEILDKIYKSEFIKVKLCRNLKSNEHVNMNSDTQSLKFYRSRSNLLGF